MGEARIPSEVARRLLDELRDRKRELGRIREPVAVVGMACRFPRAPGVAEFWRLLDRGAEAISRERPRAADRADGGGTPQWGAFLEDIEDFDAEFFRISPLEAELLDPQHRLLLETCWEAIEDAGLDAERLRGSRTGVYGGITTSDYQELTAPAAADRERGFYYVTGNSFATAVGRVAYALGLKGPAIAVDTACSSSLVALHQAVAGLQSGDADVALAGGVNAILTGGNTTALVGAGALASDGRCKTFDAAADGYVRGEGCGVLALKRLSDAKADGHRILGVLVGSAVNNDGASAGLTVPSGPAQERVMAAALERASVPPSSVDYLEAHGTGTPLGDPLEVQAAASVYGRGRPADRPLLIGSVKTNVGHLEAAAGVAGVIKVLLSMREGVIPKHRNFENPSPRIDWERLPVRVAADAVPWPGDPDRPPRAAVSSFGFSGTNAHVVIEGYGEEEVESAAAATPAVGPAEQAAVSEAPAVRIAGRPASRARCFVEREARLLPLSARTTPALRELAGRYRSWLTDDAPLPDLAWTAAVGRSHFACRAGVVFRDVAGLRERLDALEHGGARESAGEGATAGKATAGKVAFLYTGQGSQWVGMGRELYATEPVAREVLDRCEEVFRAERGESLLEVMFGDSSGGPTGVLDRTEWTQPALYALESALTALWASVGVRPDAVFGHSVGEVAAAHAAGAFDLEEGLRFAVRRGALMGSLPAGGAMAAVFASLEGVVAALPGGVSLAAANGAHQVVSGPEESVAALIEEFGASGVRAERLRTSHAFHSELMEPVLAEVAAAAPEASPPSVPLVSNVSGGEMGGAPGPEYWRRQAREPVRFGAGMATLAELGVGALVEVGPHAVLGPMATLAWPGSAAPRVAFASQGHDGSGDFVDAVARAYEAGLDLVFEGLFAGERRRRISLPTYPFQRRRHWVSGVKGRVEDGHPLLGVRRDTRDGGVSFETELSARNPGWLADHRVFGEVLAPGALFAAQAVEAARTTGGGGAVVVRDGQIRRPLVLSADEARTVQVALSPERRWEVASRPAGRGGGWELHAEGRVESLESAPGAAVDVAALRTGLEPVDLAGRYRDFKAAGIAYGPAFRGLVGLWSGEGEAVGEVALPGEAGRAGLLAHPALLDACTQVLAGVSRFGDDGALWLPLGWERIWLRGELPDRLVCRAVLREGTTETRTADLRLYAERGEELGGIAGFALRRATRAALAGAGIDDLLYEVRWREAPPAGLLGAEFLVEPEVLASRGRSGEAALEAEGLSARSLAALDRALERESRSHALRALEELGWRRRAGERFEAEDLRRRLRVAGDHRRLFGRLLGLLDEAGVVARDPEGTWVVAPDSEQPPREAPDPPDAAADSGGHGSIERALLARCGRALAEVLRGRADPLELLFGSEPSAADLYSNAPAARALNRLVGDAVEEAASALPEGRRLRILEVGAGTGGTTAAVLPRLPARRTQYTYTDISAGFFTAAERRFDGAGVEMGYRPLDIERDPAGQGFAAHGHDLVIAAHVLHATRDLGETLAHCRRLLAPSGILVAVEGTAPSGWLDLTFGLLPGWWRFDDEYRLDHALAARGVWRRVLAESGYRGTSFIDLDGGRTVIVARGPSEVEVERGLYVLAGNGDAGDALARELDRRGGRVALGPVGGDRRAWASFFESLPGDVPLRGVAHLGGVRGDGSRHSAAELEAELEAVGSGALALVQGMADAGAVPAEGVWFVTRGGQVVDREGSGALSGALMWGLASVVDLEHGDLTARLLDLDPESEFRAGALADELLFPDRETRIAWRGGGRRVARLVRAGGGTAAPEGSGGGLESDPERSVERRRVVGQAGTPHGDGEVQVAVDAVGRLRGDRSYMVTGGLGGIGLEVAGWLAEAGAGAIVLNGRREPGRRALAAVEALRERGAEVRVEIADLTDGEAVGTMLARVDAEMPPLGGIVHSVGVLADAALTNQSWERFEEVLAPKVLGAWRLHRATLDRDLELFVLFSSIVGVLGNAGQANHAAANAFLDQLARHRRALGLAGQAIAWGPWSEVGEAEERRRKGDRLFRSGVEWIAPERGLRALARLIRRDAVASVAAAVEWEGLPSRPPFLEELVAPEETSEAAAPSDLRRRLAGLSAAERERELTRFVQSELAAVLRLRSTPAADVGFFELGMDSLMAVELRNRVNRAFAGDLTLSSTAVFDHPDATRLARHLARELEGAGPEPPRTRSLPAVRRGWEEPVAIVGAACRFPGAPDLAAFRKLLASGGDAVTRGRPDGLFVDAETEADRAFGGYVEGLDRFDAGFFRIAPVEAELLDPQQRMLLETSWEALEDAGLDPGRLRGSRTGVYGGVCGHDYEGLVAASGGDPSLNLYRSTGVTASTAVGRVAFALGLEGPAITVDTACSSSLVAVHQAAAALRAGEADLALAGGVNAILTSLATRIFADAGMLSPDGRCKTFDAAADGYVRAEGCGMVVLRRLSDAEAAGDRILAVLLGSAINQDGASAGLTVPNGPAQERVIEDALARAGVEPSSVDYLEAHGTGTELGDPVEVEAAAAVYGRGRDPDSPLLLGSVKTNVGHLEAAAGVAGLIKAVEAIRSGVIPRHLHFERPNPRLDWEALPVRVTAEATRWPEAERPRRAAVSSFGYSGTNAHVVVEGYVGGRGAVGAAAADLAGASGPDRPGQPAGAAKGLAGRSHRLLPLSAKSNRALGELAARYRAWLAEDASLADVVWTAGVGRSHFAHRAGLVFRDRASLREQLAALEAGGGGGGVAVPRAASGSGEAAGSAADRVAFLYTGQGGQWAGMGRELYESEPVAREVLDRCEAAFRDERGESLLGVMFGDAGRLDHTEWTQPALYTLESALTALWASVGVRPAAVFGHSAGETAAAQAAGAFGLEAGLRFAARRGAIMGSLPAAGAMAAVFAPLDRVREALPDGVSLAANNGAHQVVSGPEEAVAALAAEFEAAGVRVEPLRTSHAFHSALMDPVLAELEAAAPEASAPSVPLVGNPTGRPLADAPDGGHWRRQAREPVQFAKAVRTLAELDIGVLIEIGPHAVLGPMAALAWPAAGAPTVVSSQRRDGSGDFVRAVGRAYEAGLDIAFDGMFAGGRRSRVSLPTYPFQRERYWVPDARHRRAAAGHSLLGARVDDLLHEVVWRESPPVGLRAADFLAGPKAIVSGLDPVDARLEAEGLDREAIGALARDLDRESDRFVLRGFRELGWDPKPGDRFEEDALRRRLKVTGDHRRLFGRLLSMMEEMGVVARDAAGGRLVAARPGRTPEAPPGPADSVELALLRRCGESLAEVLRGRADPLDLLFGGEPGAAKLYRDSGAARAFNRTVAEAVRSAVVGLPRDRSLRVLEVGAGTGGTTDGLLDALPAGRTIYTYTDISAAFFPDAERRFGERGAEFRCGTLDIERDPGEQGFAPHGHDLVIAANVLHATRDLGESLAHCRRLLAPSGILVAMEETEPRSWLDLTFGLLPGWWRFEDAYRPHYPLAPRGVWRHALADAGFAEHSFVDNGAGSVVIVARGPSQVEREPGVFVLAGSGELADALAEELRRRSQTVLPGPADGRRDSWRSFFESLPAEVPLRGVVHLGGVRGDGSRLSTGELRAELEATGSGALALVQGMTDAGASPADGVWFVTRGGQVVARERTGTLAGALLWGLSSAVEREHARLTPRLLDLDPEAPPSAAALANELLFPDLETRIALRDGGRRVARLVRAGRRPGLPEGGAWRLAADRSYLVAGGFGGMGLAVAGWLADFGAGEIVLNGRREPDARARAAIEMLRERGARVRVEIADVADADAVAGMLGRIETGLPLGGIFHAVGVRADGALANLDWTRFEEVLGPRVLGAWRLHRAALDRDLDLFVLFSGAADVLGSPGQANQATADAFLDQLARHRRALGLPGQAIALGRWRGVGQGREPPERAVDRTGPSRRERSAARPDITALTRVVREEMATGLVAAVEWEALPHRPPFLEELVATDDAPATAGPEDLLRRLAGLSAEERETELVGFVQAELAAVLRLRSAPSPDVGFFDLGMDSLMAVELRNRINRVFADDLAVSNTAVFDHPDATRLARHLNERLGEAPARGPRIGPAAASPRREEQRIAIVGMACRFPGGHDLAAFQELLASGRDAVTRGRPDGLYADAETEADRPWGGYVEGMDLFDAGFFRISPVEAELMDPQQRMLLETGWAALEDAGIDPGRLRGTSAGVYVGIANNEYQRLLDDRDRSLYAATGNLFATAVGRMAFTFGFEGPAMAIDTACSASLVAVHQAMTALLRGEADLALAGGVNAVLFGGFNPALQAAGMLSPDGRCKTFDASADGYGRGEGCGILVLKRLSDAVAAGDRVLGVLLGSAVNQDGASAGLTVPNGPAQEQVIADALARAGIEPSSVDYLEAHGTGTELGDPIELEAAAAVYGQGRDPDRPLLIGSAKTNIGHLEAAAGVAGLIKAVLAIRSGVIPPHLHFERPSPRVDWEALPVRVTAEATPWPSTGDRPPRAAVSSFGVSGTNAHVVVGGYDDDSGPLAPAAAPDLLPAEASRPHRPPKPDRPPRAARSHRLLPLSAKSEGALRELADRYRAFLAAAAPDADERSRADNSPNAADPFVADGPRLADIAWTACVGRSHFAHRAGVVFRDRASLGERLEQVRNGTGASRGATRVAFLYTGQGSQWAGMGRELHDCEPVFAEVLDRCEAAFREERDASLLGVMFGDAAEGNTGALDGTEWAQPALYALESALTALWASVGVRPDVVFGHSVGEIAAAHAAGAFDLETGLRFAARRGALMGSLPDGGAMAAVFAPLGKVRDALPEGVSLAADNGAHQVVSGPGAAVGALADDFAAAGIRVERLRTSHAFHSALMDPVLPEIARALGEAAVPTVPLVSNLTGRPLAGAPDGDHWRRQAREPVQFARAVRTLAELDVGLLIEIGPHAVLGPMAALAWPEGDAPTVVPSQRRNGGGDFVRAAASAYEAGLDLSFDGLFTGERRRRIALPTYPFQRERHWISRPRRPRAAAGHPLLGVRRDSPAGEVSFETELSARDPEWLDDHRVFGETVAPGALYAAQAIEAFREAGNGPAVVLRDGQIRQPLVVSRDAGRIVQVVLRGDGGWQVVGRDPDGAWETHAEGRCEASDAGAPEAADIDAMKAGLAPVDVADRLRASAGAAGIDYGPAFRGLVRLWSGPDEAVGEVLLPADVDRRGLLAHPALLDACFHVLAGIGEPAGKEGTWLPLGWDRLSLRGELPELVVCRAVARGEFEETVKADLRLYAETGLELGGIDGFTLKRASRAALLGARVQGLLHEVVWRESAAPGLRGAEFLAAPQAIESRLGSADDYLEWESLDREALVTQSTELERESRRHVLRGFRELGWNAKPGDRFEADELRRLLRITGDHRQLFKRLLAMLEESGLVALDPAGGWLVTDAPDSMPEAPPGPAVSIEQRLLRRCGELLAEVLRGRADPLELLFRGEGGAEELYRDSAATRAVNRMVADAVRTAISGLPEGRPLRVLEVGAGTGATTAWLLDALPAGRTGYEYTDISAGFFAAAERRFADAAVDLRYRSLDIERDPGEQGFAAHAYDLVIAANVLHATRDLEETLAHCRRLLAPSGMLVAVEGTGPQGWLDLTFGLLPGWWRFDDAYRADYALVPTRVWRRALADGGFPEASFVETAGGTLVILARGPAEVQPEPGTFVLAGAGEGTRAGEHAQAVAEELSRRGRIALAGPSDGRRDSWRSFFESLPDDVPLRGVVHLGGVRGDGSRSSAPELRADLEEVGGGALALVQGMADAGAVPADGTWFVTRGGQVVGGERSGALAGASLWGLASVVDLEHGDLKPRLLDLDPESGFPADALVDELLHPDRETRIAWRGGSRRVARLVRAGGGMGLPEGDGWRFGPNRDGSLERLRVERRPEVVLGTGEIRVAVEAAGANFLDVMVGMALVDAVSTLGGEFAGRVLEVGPEVAGTEVGDRVVGFAGGAFGPEVVTRADLVVPAPPGVPARELATVPVAFATAALAFEFAGLGPGARILVHAGTGGVGQAAIQLAHAAGHEVYATASAPKRGHLRALGVAGAFDSRDTRFGAEVMEATGGRGVALVLNSLTGEGFVEGEPVVPGGRWMLRGTGEARDPELPGRWPPPVRTCATGFWRSTALRATSRSGWGRCCGRSRSDCGRGNCGLCPTPAGRWRRRARRSTTCARRDTWGRSCWCPRRWRRAVCARIGATW